MEPRLRSATVRESILEALRGESCTARDLSRRVGIPERDVKGHLEHLERSLRRREESLVVETARCLECDFAPTRHPYSRPAHCPRCRSKRLSLPRFRVEPGGGRPGRGNRRQRAR